MTYEPIHSNYLEIPAGWIPYVSMVIDHLKTEWPELTIVQVKEKFAELRIYAEYDDYAINFIEQAKEDCEKICMGCGAEYGVELVQNKGWLFRFCKTCREKDK